MRMTLVSMIAVALLAAGACIFSQMYIGQVTDEIDGMRLEVLQLVEQGEVQRAREVLGDMDSQWRGCEMVMAAIAPHESLHEITGLIIEGSANIDAGDLDDFNRSMALLGESLHHLHLEEQLRLFNIL